MMSGVFAALLLSGFAVYLRGANAALKNNYQATILVSNEEGEGTFTDGFLKNAWGIAASPTGPWWVANNGSGTTTIYTGAGVKVLLGGLQSITVPGAPTGMVWNGGTQFEVAPGFPSTFLFASEDGTFSGWNRNFDITSAHVVHTDAEASYKGLAISGNTLFATNFAGCEVEAYDGAFAEFETAGGFADPSIDAGYCPFGIQVINNSVFVSYALKGDSDDIAGQGHGFVREFDLDGNLIAQVGTHGLLNSPWGIAMAPADFGRFGGCLLVGNFGDGRINAFCKDDEGAWHFGGQLRSDNKVIAIDGLWGIGFGNGAASGPTNVLYFAAGPDEEENGYFGKVEVAN
jgi:uncharacterized protein (TIGR03118 family)